MTIRRAGPSAWGRSRVLVHLRIGRADCKERCMVVQRAKWSIYPPHYPARPRESTGDSRAKWAMLYQKRAWGRHRASSGAGDTRR